MSGAGGALSSGWTRVPFPLLAAALTGLSWLVAWLAAPGRPLVHGGVALGTAAAGLTTSVALEVLRRVKATARPDDPESQARAAQLLVKAFAGLMLGRMLGYLAFLGAVAASRVADPLSVCVGLVGGTVLFQALEVLYLKNLR